MYSEEDLLPVSALQHLVFCERQCALIHIERAWQDNPLTLEGSHMHARVDERGPRREVRGDLIVLRGVPLRSLRLGLAGRADVVELHRHRLQVTEGDQGNGLVAARTFAQAEGLWVPFPVDYKRGRRKPGLADEVQLCGQALCLEEMLGVSVPRGALFYGRLQHRYEVTLDDQLRRTTTEAAARLHVLVRSGVTPRAVKQPKCRRCSLRQICRPEAMSRGRSARRYLADAVRRIVSEEPSTR